MTKLIIIESPSKINKIQEYLGYDYRCLSTYGHLNKIKTLKDVDINDVTKTTYSLSDKKNTVSKIMKELKKSKDIFIATDDDAEGEAIAYHFCNIFNLDVRNTKRIIFHEITKTAILHAIENPVLINLNIVKSQQIRQALDIIIGYKLSPILWKYISYNKENSLSAGRCQSSALRLVYDNHVEFGEIKDEEHYYDVYGYFLSSNLCYTLNKQFKQYSETLEFIGDIQKIKKDNCFLFHKDEPVTIMKNPHKPYITTTIQRHMGSLFHYTPKKTMEICQTLYENGFITYMRTSTEKLSSTFISSVISYLDKTHSLGDRWINENIKDIELGSGLNNREPHEAIRITDPKMTPSLFSNKNSYGPEYEKVYKCIWLNSISSCMASSLYTSIKSKMILTNEIIFENETNKIYFEGFEYFNNKEKEENNYDFITFLDNGFYTFINSLVALEKVKPSGICYYTETSLIKKLESIGIGRPSTYSSIIEKLKNKEYVKKTNIEGIRRLLNSVTLDKYDKLTEKQIIKHQGSQHGALVITSKGIMVIELLVKYFDSIVSYEYTKQMEEKLEEIYDGFFDGENILSNCVSVIDEHIIKTNKEMKDKKQEIQIDNENTFMIGKYGAVIKNVTIGEDGKEIVMFNKVIDNIDLNKLKNNEYQLEEIKKIDDNKSLGEFEGENIYVKTGPYGLYARWGDKTISLKELRKANIVTRESVIECIEKNIENIKENNTGYVRKISSNISIRTGKRGDYIFFKTIKMKKPKFFTLNGCDMDYKNCDINELKYWISGIYNIN